MKIKKNYLMILLFVGMYLIRVFGLDKDLPPWELAYYTPIDEGCYAMQAFQNVRTDIFAQAGQLSSAGYSTWNSALSFLLTIFVQFTMFIFGNNYYGLRMASVLAGLIILVILFYIVTKEEKNKNGIVLFSIGILTTFNFSFMMATRIVEPSIFRMLLVVLILLIFYKGNSEGKINYFLLGIVCVLSVTWGYITNVFVIIPIIGMIAYEKIKEKSPLLKRFLRFVAGSFCGVLISEIFMFIIQKRTFLQDLSRTLKQYGGNRGVSALSSIGTNARDLVSGNMFQYDALFLVLAIISLIVCLIIGFNKNNKMMLFTSFMTIGFVLQNILTSDFSIRKSIVIFPVIILNIAFLLNEFEKINIKKTLFVVSVFISLCALYNSYKRIIAVPELPSLMEPYFKKWVLIIMLIAVGLFLTCLLSLKYKRQIYYSVLAFYVILNMSFNYTYIFSKGETEKQVMIDLGNLVGNEYVLGFAYSYCLYNEIIPVSNAYDYYYEDDYIKRSTELVQSEKVKFYLGYQGTGYIEPWLEGSDLQWKEKRHFYTDFCSQAGNEAESDIYLYESVRGQN